MKTTNHHCADLEAVRKIIAQADECWDRAEARKFIRRWIDQGLSTTIADPRLLLSGREHVRVGFPSTISLESSAGCASLS